MPRLPRLIALALLLAAAPATAQWSADPDANFPIADRTSEQVIPKIASRPDGGTYVGWFDLASGQYDVYLQRLDANGVEQWPHNGILVSHHTQNTSLVDWDLIADSVGNAVLAFTDTRTGNLDVIAYKIAADGTFLWGPDGIDVSGTPDFEPAPRVVEASDGDFVVVWARIPNTGDGKIMMQRLAPDGTLRYAAGGLAIAGDPTERPAFTSIVAADNGSVIVSWLRNTRAFTSPRHMRARKFATDGSSPWANFVSVFDAVSVPIGYQFRSYPDGVGGAVFCWHRSQSNLFNACVQRLDASGIEVFAHNGVTASADASQHHLDPDCAYRPATGEFFVVWNERNLAQSQWGIDAQKITSAGTRAWGANGLVLQPVDNVNKILPRCVQAGDGAEIFWVDEPGGVFNQDRLLGMRLDGSGTSLWGVSPILVASHLSSKSRHPATIDLNGVAKLVWEDDRNGTPDVYGQNVNPDGTLGPAIPVPVSLSDLTALVIGGTVQLSWTVRSDADAACRVVRHAEGEGAWNRVSADLYAAAGVATMSWSDRDTRPETGYAYAVEFMERGMWSRSVPVEITTARAAFGIGAPQPNPTRGAISLYLSVSHPGPATVAIFDVRGRRVRKLLAGTLAAGTTALVWDGRDDAGRSAGAGTYFVQFRSGGETARERIVRLD